MNEPTATAIPLAYETPPPATSHHHIGFAEWMLVIATGVWGASFVLAKDGGEAINHAAGVGKHGFGPVVILAMRFTVAGLLMVALLPGARTGWTRRRLRDASIPGGLLWAGIVLQHVALDHTSEAVAAFLTSLAVIFVPVVLWLIFRQRPAPAAWLGVALAVPGVWFMSDPADIAAGFSLGIGTWMGLTAATLFAAHLVALGRLAPSVGTLRMCAGQFLVVGLACWAIVPLFAIHIRHFDTTVFAGPRVWLDVGLLVLGPTFVSFGLMTRFQPLVSPVRAVMIYLFEPLAAAFFAWIWAGHAMTIGMWLGGGLILVANAVVEILPVVVRRRRGLTAT